MCIRDRFNGPFDAEEGMVRDVESEHLLLEGQLDLLVPLHVRDREPDRFDLVAPAAEQAVLAHLLSAAPRNRCIERVMGDFEKTPSGVTERIERATLDERFDGPLAVSYTHLTLPTILR